MVIVVDLVFNVSVFVFIRDLEFDYCVVVELDGWVVFVYFGLCEIWSVDIWVYRVECGWNFVW